MNKAQAKLVIAEYVKRFPQNIPVEVALGWAEDIREFKWEEDLALTAAKTTHRIANYCTFANLEHVYKTLWSRRQKERLEKMKAEEVRTKQRTASSPRNEIMRGVVMDVVLRRKKIPDIQAETERRCAEAGV